jgi:antitoxin component YwqK of YwqJK toxin-antitoxin module
MRIIFPLFVVILAGLTARSQNPAISPHSGNSSTHTDHPTTRSGSPTPHSGNPVFPGWYADPETAVFGSTYWIFPTYSAPYKDQAFFDAFSSPDLIHWQKHARILDTSAVTWAKKAMWAPAIAQMGGKYYFFFGANDIQNDSSLGGVGIAVADSPEGPYRDYLGHPLIGQFHNGAQPIDQAVFQDRDGSWYIIYGGWRHCNIARLKPDFTGLEPFADGTTFKEITPEKYVEGPYMIYRKNKYYFMWSEGGWGGPDYSVAYAMADSPTGPFKRIGKILQQDMHVATGAGHHSVLHIPGTDDYYIVYHRRPLGETDPNHRVVCIDKMEFDANGLIKPVTITKDGVTPRPLVTPSSTAAPSPSSSPSKKPIFYDYRWQPTTAAHARYYSTVEHTDSGWLRTDFYLNSNTLVMEGLFEDSNCKKPSGRITRFYPDKKPESTGRYTHGRKDGLWLSFYWNGMMADSSVYADGNFIGTRLAWYPDGTLADSAVYRSDGSGIFVQWFANGNPSVAGNFAPDYKPQGKWQFFHDNGKLSALEVYDKGSLLDKKYFDESGQPRQDTTSRDRKASFRGGPKEWNLYVRKHGNFPSGVDLTNSDSVTVIIGCTIDENGNIRDVFVSTPFNPIFDRKALDILRNSPKWLPAIEHNRRVSSRVRMPIGFYEPG